MITQKFYINGNEVLPPKNWQALAIELNYGKDSLPSGTTITITDFEWVRENYDTLLKHIEGGMTGDVGIFEAPSFKHEISNGTISKTIFDGYIDMSNSILIKDRIKITAKSMSRTSVDWLNDVASGFTFEYLASLPKGSKGAINSDNYRYMPYVNNSVPDYTQAAIATLMIYSISQSIITSIKTISAHAADAGGYFTTIPAVIKLILEIAYLTVLILVLIKLVQDMIKFLISPVKYHAGMYVRDLLAKGCEFLGLTFVSDIWAENSDYRDEFIIPEKLYNPPDKLDGSVLGFIKPDKNEQTGYYKGTFAQLLDDLKKKYNAKIVVTENSELVFVRKDKNAQPPTYQLPGIYQPEYTYNTDELQANTLIEFRTDPTDTNTFNNYSGTIYQVICQPKVVRNQAFVMMKNLNTVSIPFARASIKTDLSVPEKLMKGFLEVFEAIGNVLVAVTNVVIGIINTVLSIVKKIFKFFGIKIKINPIPKLKKLSLASSIDNRKGMMVLSNDHFNVAKIFILQEGSEPKYNKISSLNALVQTAKAHWKGFHYVNSFIPAQLNPDYSDRPTGNQFKIKSFDKVSFGWLNFLAVFKNNRIFDSNGNIAILESLKFNPYLQSASMKVRFSEIYTLNLQETFLEPTGA